MAAMRRVPVLLAPIAVLVLAMSFALGAFGAGRPVCGTFTNGDAPACQLTEGPDNVNALGGNDDVEGLGGDDTLYGADGNGPLVGVAGNDTLTGVGGRDTP